MPRDLYQRRVGRGLVTAALAISLIITAEVVAASAGGGDTQDTQVGEVDEPDSSLDAGERAVAEAEARSAELRAESDASYIPCFTSDGLLATVVILDLSDPGAPPMSVEERDAYCKRNFPGTRGSRS